MNKKIILLLFLCPLLQGASAQIRSQERTSVVVKYEDATLQELSGMCYWDQSLWCINDSDHEALLYRVDPSAGGLLDTFLIANAGNRDWEALSQDMNYFYIGDFGNNSGKRSNLTLYRLEKAQLTPENRTVAATAMHIVYPDPLPVPEKPNHTDFDAEAMVVAGDSIYIFTKRWASGGTEIYQTAFKEGTVVLKRAGFLPVDVLITDAAYNEEQPALYLLAYHKPLKGSSVILYILPGKPGQWDLSKGKRIRLDLTLKQAEALAVTPGNALYIGCEGYRRGIRSRAAIYFIVNSE